MFSSSALYRDAHDNPHITYTYIRYDQVEKQCGSVLSSVSELKPDNNGGDTITIRNKLSFLNGNWNQEPGGSPLMPFDDSDMPRNVQFSFLKFDVKRYQRRI